MSYLETTSLSFQTQLSDLARKHQVEVESDEDSLQLLDPEAFAQIQVETPETDTTFAFFGYSLSDDKTTISDLIVAINQVAFLQKDQDYSDLIPVVIRHELAEMFFHVSTGSTDEQAAHAYALSEEYRLAFELGVEERYLELIGHWSRELPATAAAQFL